jgi:hypothetical protein
LAYNNLTSRTDAAALIPEEVSNVMLGKATEQSAVLQLFRRIPVGRAQVRFPVLSALPVAYWVNGDTGLKQTTEINWANKFLNIEESPRSCRSRTTCSPTWTPTSGTRRCPTSWRRSAGPSTGRVLRHERPLVVPDERS